MCNDTKSQHLSSGSQNFKIYEPPLCLKKEFDSFIDYLKRRELKDSTIDKYRRNCAFILTDFANNGVTGWQDVNLQVLADSFKRTTNKDMFRTPIRMLFAYLARIGVIKTDYSVALPRPRKPQRVPSVYSKAETEKLLNAIDRKTSVGKRDYAVILLALRLGLRNSDIMNLKFENINFENSFIDFTQFKTSVPHRLNMPIDVMEALKDYINNGRKQLDDERIFLSDNSIAPLHRSRISAIVTRRLEKAGIDCKGRHHGPHALRSTFASELLAEKVPYDAVRVILGHTNPGSTRYYTKMSIEDLRTCALEVPPPSGLFAKYLSGVRT